jgi:predicted house-cleaning NTP pyrophosphatase (Maf/HAM1 superfamily)
MNPIPLILASASPRRVELLRRLTPDFQVIPSDAAEVHDAALEIGRASCRERVSPEV